MSEYKYNIQADNTLDAATQLLDAFRKLSPGTENLTLDFEDGSRVTIKVKKPKLKSR